MTSSRTESVAPPDRRLQAMATLIELEKRLRAAESELALSFLLVNETHGLAPYRQAILWQNRAGPKGRIAAMSGLSAPDPNSPFVSWMRKLCSHLDANNSGGEPVVVKAEALPEQFCREWAGWLPGQALWLPLHSPAASRSSASDEHGPGAGLLLAREEPWTDAELKLLGYLGDSAGHAWRALAVPRKSWRTLIPRRKPVTLSLMLLGLAVLMLPIHQSTLSPAEVVARDPVVIRAPIDGVVYQVEVDANASVGRGQPLLSLDATRLTNRLEVAETALEVIEAEYRQAAQQGLFDNRANAGLAMLKGRMEQQEAEVNYLKGLLDRIVIRSPQPGIAIVDDPDEWLGKPVSIGERIMLVADPDATELELRVPVADAIALEEGARVRLFLNTDPHHPVEAILSYASYQATLTPEGILAYRLVAAFPEGSSPLRIGLKGTARLYGDRTTVAMYLFRRPLQALRQAVGL